MGVFVGWQRAGQGQKSVRSLRSSGHLLFPVSAVLPQPCSAGICALHAGAVQASRVPVVHIPSDASLSAALLSSSVLFIFFLCV